MRPQFILCLLTALLMAPGASVRATATDDVSDGFAAAEALFGNGQYGAAVTAARALDTADGLALAARARLLLVRFSMPPAERLAAIEAALGDARRALAMDENHLEANLQAAVALGYRGKLRRSIRDAWAGRRHIDRALEHHPESSWALAALGGWNGEVVMEAGRFFASTLFGAGRSKAIRHFRMAVAAEPVNLAVRASFVETLLRFGKSRFEAEALAVLEESVVLPARNALEEMMLGQMRALLTALQEERRDDLKTLLESMTAFPDQ